MNRFNSLQCDTSNRISDDRAATIAMYPEPTGARRKYLVDEQELKTKVSGTIRERIAAFELVHRMYCRAGLTAENQMRMRVMKHHLLNTTEILVAKRNGEVESTLTLVRDGEYGLPAESLFTEEVQSMRAGGIRLAEVSCVASTCEGKNKKQRLETLIAIFGLAVHVARRRGVQRALMAVHPRHAKFYQRLLGCVPFTEVKQYNAVQGNPAVLCMHDFAQLDETKYTLYNQIYRMKYTPWDLDGSLMSANERSFFRLALPADSAEQSLVPMAA